MKLHFIQAPAAQLVELTQRWVGADFANRFNCNAATMTSMRWYATNDRALADFFERIDCTLRTDRGWNVLKKNTP